MNKIIKINGDLYLYKKKCMTVYDLYLKLKKYYPM